MADFHGFKVKKQKFFVDYIMGGCEIKLHIAVDFTGSNGYQPDGISLHA
jgi:hypothetical protein